MLYAVSIFIENIVLILNYTIRAFSSSLTLKNMILFCVSVLIENIVLFSVCAFFFHRERDMTLYEHRHRENTVDFKHFHRRI